MWALWFTITFIIAIASFKGAIGGVAAYYQFGSLMNELSTERKSIHKWGIGISSSAIIAWLILCITVESIAKEQTAVIIGWVTGLVGALFMVFKSKLGLYMDVLEATRPRAYTQEQNLLEIQKLLVKNKSFFGHEYVEKFGNSLDKLMGNNEKQPPIETKQEKIIEPEAPNNTRPYVLGDFTREEIDKFIVGDDDTIDIPIDKQKKLSKMFNINYNDVLMVQEAKAKDKIALVYSFSPATLFEDNNSFYYIVEVNTRKHRYFALEEAYLGNFVLYEWEFDENLKMCKHTIIGEPINILDSINGKGNTFERILKQIEEVL